MNPRAEAVARLDGRYDARVLEPSPPAVGDPPWFADDPVGRGEPAGGRPRVSPVDGGDLRWDDLLARDADLAGWCAERWLGAHRRLPPPPDGLAATRVSLHRLAEHVVSPARAQANGKIALRFTRGGFGTPFFGDDVQLRVAGDHLTVDDHAGERSAPITTLGAMAAHVAPHLGPGTRVPDADRPLTVDPAAAAFLGDWFGFATSVLEELRAGAGDEHEPSRVQLWPEHFDLAVELGREADGRRAGYGASPGDELHRLPYLYVTPWAAVPDGPLWQTQPFPGAELGCAALLEAGDQRTAALSFFRQRLAALGVPG
jgi:hypothetical protein